MIRVVITGMGVVCPIANNIKDYWKALKNGINGAGFITKLNAYNDVIKIACEIKNLNINNFLSKKDIRKTDISSQYGLISCFEALKNSNLKINKKNNKNIGIIWGSGLGNISSIETELLKYKNKIYDPYFLSKTLFDSTSGLISLKYNIKGYNYTIGSSCTSSSNAIINAYNAIISGDKIVMITGGSEAPITTTCLNSFNTLNVLSKNKNPKKACKPFDKNRDGFIMGEGSGTIILENYKYAKLRKAKIYGEIIGVGSSSDGFDITHPDPYGSGITQAVHIALKESKIKKSDINYICSHAASTIIGDIIEINALKNIFGKLLYNKIYVNSIKSMTGHLLGASGIIESIATILTIKKNIIPPTINQNELDKNIDKNILIVKNKSIKKKINIGLINNIGFWGHNTSIIYKSIK